MVPRKTCLKNVYNFITVAFMPYGKTFNKNNYELGIPHPCKFCKFWAMVSESYSWEEIVFYDTYNIIYPH